LKRRVGCWASSTRRVKKLDKKLDELAVAADALKTEFASPPG
jgi:hypothetical protein